ncbi:class E sortase [Candidatus Saccharibacteria bacterium]|nr:class E sortase [Candidatus Saccharibacteria bacterium]
MNSENGGQSSNDLARQAAAQIARKKVLAAYAAGARKSALANSAESGKLREEPVTTQINSESWKKYHSAWQSYYQKYYNDYYSKAAQDYIAKERLKDAREKAEEEEILSSITKFSKKSGRTAGLSLESTGNVPEDDTTIGGRLKHRIRAKATESAKQTRRKRKFVPILAGVFVVLLILFLQYNRLIFAPIMAYVSPGNAPVSGIDAIDPTVTQTVSADPRLIIPKLNVDVPIRFEVPLSGVMDAMADGVAHYRIAGASAYPGEIGNFVITGHSAGDVYSSNQYKYIFSGLERLEDGDLIYVNYNSVRYTYRVVRKQIIDPSNVAALVMDTDKPLLTLVTCTPLGTSRNRLLVTAEQISPSYDGASEADKVTPVIDSAMNDTLPSNEPSFFEGMWNFLTGQ